MKAFPLTTLGATDPTHPPYNALQDVVVLIDAGQSNSLGAPNKAAMSPLANVYQIDTASSSAMDESVSWVNFANQAALDSVPEGNYHLSSEISEIWQAHIDAGNVYNLPDLYIIHVARSGQGMDDTEVGGNNHWYIGRDENSTESLFHFAKLKIAGAIKDLRSRDKNVRLAGIHWNQHETTSQSDEIADPSAAMRLREFFANLFAYTDPSLSPFNDATGVPVYLYPADIQAIWGTAESRAAVQKVQQDLVDAHPNFRFINPRQYPGYNADAPNGFGIFRGDGHYIGAVYTWFAQEQFKNMTQRGIYGPAVTSVLGIPSNANTSSVDLTPLNNDIADIQTRVSLLENPKRYLLDSFPVTTGVSAAVVPTQSNITIESDAVTQVADTYSGLIFTPEATPISLASGVGDHQYFDIAAGEVLSAQVGIDKLVSADGNDFSVIFVTTVNPGNSVSLSWGDNHLQIIPAWDGTSWFSDFGGYDGANRTGLSGQDSTLADGETVRTYVYSFKDGACTIYVDGVALGSGLAGSFAGRTEVSALQIGSASWPCEMDLYGVILRNQETTAAEVAAIHEWRQGAFVSASASSFAPTPDFIDDSEATYFYFGWATDTDWRIIRQTRSDGAEVRATRSTNAAYDDLATAWVNRSGLAYA